MTTAFVYKWTHLPTLKWYIGSRTSKNCHPNDGYICSSQSVKPMIQNNPNDWEREILFVGEPTEAFNYECMLLDLFDAKNDPRSFNLHNTDGKCTNTGRSPSEETRKRLSKSGKGRIITPEHRAKISSALTGKVRSPEHSANISKANKGKKRSEEIRLKMSKASTGRKKSEEERLAMSQRMKGHKMHLGKKRSEETKAKISAALTGIKRPPISEEHRRKISIAGRNRVKVIVICPHCQKEGAKNLMTRWHFDNCKYKEK